MGNTYLQESITTDVTTTNDSIFVASCTLNELFDNNDIIIKDKNSLINGKLVVPEYQRPYCWGRKEIDNLITDLTEYFKQQDNKSCYYLGSIVLHQKNGELRIIDGLQRLTTLALFYWVKNKKAPYIQYSSPKTKDTILHNHKYIEELKEQISIIKFDKLNTTLVITNIEDEAYTFFETQNTGGVRLNGVDIIKAHHLRAVPETGGLRNLYASTWESKSKISEVVKLLLKARYWNKLKWKDFPSLKEKGWLKSIIIEEFSKNTNRKKAFAYQSLIIDDSSDTLITSNSSLRYNVRQPLKEGKNFIHYLCQFTEINEALFHQTVDVRISKDFHYFIQIIRNHRRGLDNIFLLYKICMITYVQKYGYQNLLSAAYHIFRVVFSLRLKHERQVREDSIPVFLRDTYNIIDHILHSFDEVQLIEELCEFNYKIDTSNMDKGKTKRFFIIWVAEYFNFSLELEKENSLELVRDTFDNKLKEAINIKLSHAKI